MARKASQADWPFLKDPSSWIGDATVADAILDRLLSRSHRLVLKGESLRPRKASKLDPAGDPHLTPAKAATGPQ